MKQNRIFARVWAVLLVCVLVLGSLTGCSGRQDRQTENTSQTKLARQSSETLSETVSVETNENSDKTDGAHVDVLRIGTTYKASSYSMMDTNSAFGRMIYNSFVNLNFWAFDENGQISGDGCFFRSWEVSEDNTQLTAHFDIADLYWHDGNPVTTADVEFTFHYFKAQNYPWFLRIDAVEILDDSTVRLTFNDKYAFAFLNSSNLSYTILPKHVWEKVEDPAQYDGEDAAIGCGPFRLVSKDADAQVSYYEAVENYPLGEITIDKVELHSYDTQSSLLAAMQNNEIDVMYGYSSSLDTTLLPLVDADENIDRGESQNTATYQIMFGFNQYPTNDLNFRQAVRYALDYQLLSDSLTGGYGQPADQGAVSPSCLGHVAGLEANARDLEKAAQYLDEGGFLDVDGDGYREFPDGSEMNVKIQLQNQNDLYSRIAEMMQINLDEAGIRTTVDEQTISNADYAKQLRMEGTYEIYISMTTVGMASWAGIANYLADVTITSGQHFGTYGDEDYLAAYNGMLYSSNYDEYVEQFALIQQMNVSDCPGIALAIMQTFYPYRTDRITGWTNYPAWGVINPTTWYTAVAK